MRPYWAVMSARFRVLLQYRAAAVAGFGTQLFWGLIRMMIFGAFYRSTTAAQPMDWRETLDYIWLGQAMFAMLSWSMDQDIRAMIRSGTVVYELLRPLDLYNTWFSRAIAFRVAPTLLRAVPMFMVAGLFFGLRPPQSVAAGLAWVAGTFGALMVGCAITNLMSISLLWTVSGEGVSRLLPACVWVLSGMIIPIPLMPDWLQPVLNALPFRHLVDTPFRLYIGHIPPQDAMWVFAQQAAWAVTLIGLGRWILSRGVRRMVAQGG